METNNPPDAHLFDLADKLLDNKYTWLRENMIINMLCELAIVYDKLNEKDIDNDIDIKTILTLTRNKETIKDLAYKDIIKYAEQYKRYHHINNNPVYIRLSRDGLYNNSNKAYYIYINTQIDVILGRSVLRYIFKEMIRHDTLKILSCMNELDTKSKSRNKDDYDHLIVSQLSTTIRDAIDNSYM